MWLLLRSSVYVAYWAFSGSGRRCRRRARPSSILEGEAFRDIALIFIRSECRMRVAMRQSGHRIASPYLFEPVWIWQSSTTLFDGFPGFRERSSATYVRNVRRICQSIHPIINHPITHQTMARVPFFAASDMPCAYICTA